MRPVAIGYWTGPAHGVSDLERIQAVIWRGKIEALATREGYALADIYTSETTLGERALDVLVGALARTRAVAVIVPDLTHLQYCPGSTATDPAGMARHLLARVLTVEPTQGPNAGEPRGPGSVDAGPAVLR